MSLKEDLQEINGVGEATAKKIMTVFEDHKTESEQVGEMQEVRDALDYIQEGRPGYAEKFLRRVVE